MYVCIYDVEQVFTVFEIRTFNLFGYFSGNAEEPLNQNKRSKNQLWVWRSL